MKKLVLSIMVVCSLTTCVGLLWLWHESYDAWRDIGYCWVDYGGGQVHFLMITSTDGVVILSSVVEKYPPPLDQTQASSGFRFQAYSGRDRMWGFALPSLIQIGQYGNGWRQFK